jgi:hypothetical protein
LNHSNYRWEALASGLYEAKVAAKNARGWGSHSPVSAPMVVSDGRPPAPGAHAAARGGGVSMVTSEW